MARGMLDPPNLDDRTWQDIVDQAKALIPKYTPEWTDTSPSDLGITLIELFAWIVEGMIYRLNQVPERNYIEFLNLLGITRSPASPATTMLQFTALPTQKVPVDVAAGTQVATAATETQPAIVFETDSSLRVLPGNLVEAHFAADDNSTPIKTEDVATDLISKPLSGLPLEFQAVKVSALYFGFDAAVATSLALEVHITDVDGFQQGVAVNQGTLAVTWSYRCKKSATTIAWEVFKPKDVSDETAGFRQTGRVILPVEVDWTQQKRSEWSKQPPDPLNPGSDLPRYWIKLTLAYSHPDSMRKTRIKLDHVLFNSVQATNALTTKQPELFSSDGTPFQRFELRFRPLYRIPGTTEPYEHLKVHVLNAPESDKPWTVVEEFPLGESRIVRVLPAMGSIEFGDGQRGQIPPAVTKNDPPNIQVRSYRYVAGGASGNVAAGAISQIQAPIELCQKVTVTNPEPARGGADEEEIEQTKRRGPEALRNRSRAVTLEDFEYLAREASTAVARVRSLAALKPFAADHSYGGLDRHEGHVNLIVVPNVPDDEPATEHRVAT